MVAALIGALAVWSCHQHPIISDSRAAELSFDVVNGTKNVPIFGRDINEKREFWFSNNGGQVLWKRRNFHVSDGGNVVLSAERYFCFFLVQAETSSNVIRITDYQSDPISDIISRCLTGIGEFYKNQNFIVVQENLRFNNRDICPQLALTVLFGKTDGILRGFGGILGGFDKLLSIDAAGSHFGELGLHGSPLQIGYYSAAAGYTRDDNREDAHLARPSGHNPFVALVIGLLFLGLGGISMILAFKGAEKADDYGFSWWWAPLVFFVLLSLLLMGQGIKFLGRYDDIQKTKALYTDSSAYIARLGIPPPSVEDAGQPRLPVSPAVAAIPESKARRYTPDKDCWGARCIGYENCFENIRCSRSLGYPFSWPGSLDNWVSIYFSASSQTQSASLLSSGFESTQ